MHGNFKYLPFPIPETSCLNGQIQLQILRSCHFPSLTPSPSPCNIDSKCLDPTEKQHPLSDQSFETGLFLPSLIITHKVHTCPFYVPNQADWTWKFDTATCLEISQFYEKGGMRRSRIRCLEVRLPDNVTSKECLLCLFGYGDVSTFIAKYATPVCLLDIRACQCHQKILFC